jgi:transposase
MSSIQVNSLEFPPSETISSGNREGKYLTSFQRSLLQSKLKDDLSFHSRQRIEIMLLADSGIKQSSIAKKLNCSPQTVRHWTFVARSGEAHNWEQQKLGRPKIADESYQERLREVVLKSPKEVQVPNRDYTYRQRNWTAGLLSKHLSIEFGVEVTARHISRLLKQMGLSTRPRGQSEKVSEKLQSPIQVNRIFIRDLSC